MERARKREKSPASHSGRYFSQQNRPRTTQQSTRPSRGRRRRGGGSRLGGREEALSSQAVADGAEGGAASSTAPMEIPGMRYDPVTKKYFACTSESGADAGDQRDPLTVHTAADTRRSKGKGESGTHLRFDNNSDDEFTGIPTFANASKSRNTLNLGRVGNSFARLAARKLGHAAPLSASAGTSIMVNRMCRIDAWLPPDILAVIPIDVPLELQAKYRGNYSIVVYKDYLWTRIDGREYRLHSNFYLHQVTSWYAQPLSAVLSSYRGTVRLRVLLITDPYTRGVGRRVMGWQLEDRSSERDPSKLPQDSWESEIDCEAFGPRDACFLLARGGWGDKSMYLYQSKVSRLAGVTAEGGRDCIRGVSVLASRRRDVLVRCNLNQAAVAPMAVITGTRAGKLIGVDARIGRTNDYEPVNMSSKYSDFKLFQRSEYKLCALTMDGHLLDLDMRMPGAKPVREWQHDTRTLIGLFGMTVTTDETLMAIGFGDLQVRIFDVSRHSVIKTIKSRSRARTLAWMDGGSSHDGPYLIGSPQRSGHPDWARTYGDRCELFSGFRVEVNRCEIDGTELVSL